MEAGAFVGALGDVSLQLADRLGFGNEGLAPYFKKQGPVVSVVKAALLTGFWSEVYFSLFRPPTLLGFAFFAGALDVLYRYAHPFLYPTLDTYYAKNTPAATILYNVVTAALVWWVHENLNL